MIGYRQTISLAIALATTTLEKHGFCSFVKTTRFAYAAKAKYMRPAWEVHFEKFEVIKYKKNREREQMLGERDRGIGKLVSQNSCSGRKAYYIRMFK